MNNEVEPIQVAVREHYAQAARKVLQSSPSQRRCCGENTALSHAVPADPATNCLYEESTLKEVPPAAALASLGCGNPTALAELNAGETVLDLGSGGGIDVLLSAKRVGPTGMVYGLDMTDEMLELAERNRVEAGAENVRFLKGVIEAIPLLDESVDVVISNCVINLSADKGHVLREAYRVLVPGGRFAVSDIVLRGQMPEAVRQDRQAWVGCIAGALEEETYRRLLSDAGFVEITFEVTRAFSREDLSEEEQRDAQYNALSEAEQNKLAGVFVSAFVRARKPA